MGESGSWKLSGIGGMLMKVTPAGEGTAVLEGDPYLPA